jgi:hypothetical protein
MKMVDFNEMYIFVQQAILEQIMVVVCTGLIMNIRVTGCEILKAMGMKRSTFFTLDSCLAYSST